MTPAEWDAKAKELEKKVQPPTLSREEKKQAIAAYRQLPRARQLVLKQLMKYSCSYCEAEYKVPNVGASHGICVRHKEDMYRQMGRQAPPTTTPENKRAVDLKMLSPEELQLAIKLFGILREKDKGRLARRKDLQPA